METKIVYVVYGSRTEISNLIAFLVSGEWAFNYSGEYLYRLQVIGNIHQKQNEHD